MSRDLIERVYYEVATLQPPSAPFAVVAIYPDQRDGAGCKAIVKSLHQTEVEAESARAVLKGSVQ
jgi:hypothetical protein